MRPSTGSVQQPIARKLLVSLLALGVVALSAATAAWASDYTSSIVVPRPFVAEGDPGMAVFTSHARYATIETVCLHVSFDTANPLDPGEELVFTPNSWPRTAPGFSQGPGYENVGTAPQYQRSLCAVQYPGFPPDPFVEAFLDGRQILDLTARGGSVLIDRIDVEIFGARE